MIGCAFVWGRTGSIIMTVTGKLTLLVTTPSLTVNAMLSVPSRGISAVRMSVRLVGFAPDPVGITMLWSRIKDWSEDWAKKVKALDGDVPPVI